MIGKYVRSYVKSKALFKTHFFYLSKLGEQAKIRLHYKFQIYINFSLIKKLIQLVYIESYDCPRFRHPPYIDYIYFAKFNH